MFLFNHMTKDVKSDASSQTADYSTTARTAILCITSYYPLKGTAFYLSIG